MNAVASRNIKFVGHCDLGGRGDGVQIMVHRGYAYIGHGFSNGITTVDVRDAEHPKVLDFIACPPGTRAFHLQTHDDLLLAVNAPSVWTMQEFQNEKAYFGGSPADKLKDQSRFTSGIRVYDISKPEKPVEIGFMPVDGLGPHRIWYTGGRYAYASIHFADFTDHILAVIDMSNPRKPEVAGRFWLPGMWRAGGETPNWRDRQALRAPSRARRRQSRIRGLARRRPVGARRCRSGKAQDAGLSQHGSTVRRRHALAVAATGPQSSGSWRRADLGQLQEGLRYIWMFDVREPGNPVSIATFPQPAEADYCAKGGSFGPHNLHENRPGSFQSSRLIFATYYNAGVRAYDIENPVPAARGRLLRAARSDAHDGSAPEPAEGYPILRLLRRSQRADVSHRPQCRALHSAVRRHLRQRCAVALHAQSPRGVKHPGVPARCFRQAVSAAWVTGWSARPETLGANATIAAIAAIMMAISRTMAVPRRSRSRLTSGIEIRTSGCGGL